MFAFRGASILQRDWILACGGLAYLAFVLRSRWPHACVIADQLQSHLLVLTWRNMLLDCFWPRVCKNAKICVSPKIFPTSTQELRPLAIAGNTDGYALSLKQYPLPVLKKRVGAFTQARPKPAGQTSRSKPRQATEMDRERVMNRAHVFVVRCALSRVARVQATRIRSGSEDFAPEEQCEAVSSFIN